MENKEGRKKEEKEKNIIEKREHILWGERDSGLIDAVCDG